MRRQFLVWPFLLLFAFGCGKNLDQQLKESIRNVDNAELKSGDIEILDVQQSGDLAIAEVKIQTAFKLRRQGESWTLEEIRLGDRRWERAEVVLQALNLERIAEARRQLELIQAGIERFREAEGGLPQVEDFQQLMDRLTPRYLSRVIRLDPWSQDYSFRLISTGSYDLRSAGRDGELNTDDDVLAGASSE